MKKILLLLFFLSVILSVNSQNFSVLDYFKLLPDSLVHGYKLYKKNNIWFTHSWAEYENEYIEIKAIVDIKNGYIEINDEGTGGGRTILKVALYRKIDGSALIGISYLFRDDLADSDIKFLEYNNNKWQLVTDEVLPEITYKNFMKDDFKIYDLKYPLSIYFDLPRYGTEIKVVLLYELIKWECDEECLTEKQKYACQFIENVKTDTIALIWDKQNTKFILR